jgi:hypothetical protein
MPKNSNAKVLAKPSITPEQIRAAMAILKWDDKDLSAAAKIGSTTAYSMKMGNHSPRADLLRQVKNALEAAGIEFIADRGVALRRDALEVIEGEGCYTRLMERILSLMGDRQEDICFINTRDNLSPSDVNALVEQMRSRGMTTRFICEEGDLTQTFPRRDYRWMPTQFFNNDVQVIFGEYVGTLINKGEAVYLIHNASYAETQRKIFNFVWSNCKMPIEKKDD